MKTRAFDPIEKRWRTDYAIMPDGSIYEIYASEEYVTQLINRVNWKLSRFTGLCDRNGEEIYEGDIVKYPEYYFGDSIMPAGTEIIEWEGNGFNEVLWFGYGNYPAWVEVIGNIFENPELIEATP